MSVPRWVMIKRAAELTGYSEDAIRHKVKDGTWAQGRVWRKAPDSSASRGDFCTSVSTCAAGPLFSALTFSTGLCAMSAMSTWPAVRLRPVRASPTRAEASVNCMPRRSKTS